MHGSFHDIDDCIGLITCQQIWCLKLTVNELLKVLFLFLFLQLFQYVSSDYYLPTIACFSNTSELTRFVCHLKETLIATIKLWKSLQLLQHHYIC
jgi:hypothetical protein